MAAWADKFCGKFVLQNDMLRPSAEPQLKPQQLLSDSGEWQPSNNIKVSLNILIIQAVENCTTRMRSLL
jgi:hypothetical protein